MADSSSRFDIVEEEGETEVQAVSPEFEREVDLLLSMLSMTDGIPTVADLMDCPLAPYITLAANDCGYSGTAEELIVSYVHPLFLKAHSAASKLDNPSWKEAIQGKFANEYWKAMELEIATL